MPGEMPEMPVRSIRPTHGRPAAARAGRRPAAALAARLAGRLAVVAVVASVALAACGGAGVDPLASRATPIDASPAPTPCDHCAPDLEALLPTRIGSTALTLNSYDGPDFAATGTPANRQQLDTLLARLGKTENDLSVAQATDPTATLAFQEGIFRVSGVDPIVLRDGWVAAQQQASPRISVTTVDIAGQHIERLSTTGVVSEGVTYVVPRGDMLYLILADDPVLVKQAISLIK